MVIRSIGKLAVIAIGCILFRRTYSELPNQLSVGDSIRLLGYRKTAHFEYVCIPFLCYSDDKKLIFFSRLNIAYLVANMMFWGLWSCPSIIPTLGLDLVVGFLCFHHWLS